MGCTTDPIADFLTRIRNSIMVRHEKTDVPASKMKEELAKVLRDEGYIKNYKRIESRTQGILRIYLKYGENNESVITDLQRYSKPGLRRYCGYDKMPLVREGMGIVILSTSKGIMTGQRAKQEKIGGEVLCTVW